MPEGVLTCPACGGRSRLPANSSGRDKVRCPLCKGAIRIADEPLPVAKVIDQGDAHSAPLGRGQQRYADKLICRKGEVVYDYRVTASEPGLFELVFQADANDIARWWMIAGGGALLCVVALILIVVLARGVGLAIGLVVVILLLGLIVVGLVNRFLRIGSGWRFDRQAQRVGRLRHGRFERSWPLQKVHAVCLMYAEYDDSSPNVDSYQLILLTDSNRTLFSTDFMEWVKDPSAAELVRLAASISAALEVPLMIGQMNPSKASRRLRKTLDLLAQSSGTRWEG